MEHSPQQSLLLSSAFLCRQLLSAPDLPSKLQVLGDLKELASCSAGAQLQIIQEGCMPALVSAMEEGGEEEKVQATTIIMRCALIGIRR